MIEIAFALPGLGNLRLQKFHLPVYTPKSKQLLFVIIIINHPCVFYWKHSIYESIPHQKYIWVY